MESSWGVVMGHVRDSDDPGIHAGLGSELGREALGPGGLVPGSLSSDTILHLLGGDKDLSQDPGATLPVLPLPEMEKQEQGGWPVGAIISFGLFNVKVPSEGE